MTQTVHRAMQSKLGTTTNDSAAAGEIGEYISAQVLIASGVAATSGVIYSVTSISLTAGDWDVSGVLTFSTSTSSIYGMTAGISVTAATFSTEDYQSTNFASALSGDSSFATPATRILIASTTTVYLIGRVGYSSGTAKIGGTIRARRVR